MRLSPLVPLAGIILSTALPAQEVVRLSPAEREAALEAGAARADRDLPVNGLSRGVHGEIGTEFSSNGGHAVYGTAAVPLGENGGATVSFFNGNSGHLRPR